VKFEWNASKAARNLKIHGVSFDDASTVFGDPLAATIDDPLHSHAERRSVTIGVAASGQLLVVSHTDRGEAVRLISARPATRAERRAYDHDEEAR
jgi:uncharacterized protein